LRSLLIYTFFLKLKVITQQQRQEVSHLEEERLLMHWSRAYKFRGLCAKHLEIQVCVESSWSG
jgi:hypothetical protein